MLIPSRRHSAADIAWWGPRERVDLAMAKTARMKRMEDDAVACVRAFADAMPGRCYAGFSGGKDSTCLVGVLRRVARDHGIVLPVVYVRVTPHENPDNALVLDALKASCSAALACLDVIDVACERDPDTGEWMGTGRLREGFDLAASRYGARHVSGIRAEESDDRTLRAVSARRYQRGAGLYADGTTTKNTCAPLSLWTGDDVFAYLAGEGLPVHPTYACTLGGTMDRRKLRVATLGGQRGGTRRAMHELHYYADEMAALGFYRRTR